MKITGTSCKIGNDELLIRCAEESDAEILIDYLKIVSSESRHLRCEGDEISATIEEELKFINDANSGERSLLLLAFLNGEFAGNCSFFPAGPSRRHKHRVSFGIALFQRFTGRGIGKLLLKRLIEAAKDTSDIEQCELSVSSTNSRAISLYESLGFIECGKVPDACIYDDGTKSDEIFMHLKLN